MSEATMRAVRFHEYGPAENLRVEEIARPVPQEGQVLVRVRAVGVHPFDCKVRRGLIPVSLPHIPGVDFAGVVEAVGSGVEDLQVGDEVYGGAGGTYAQYVAAPAGSTARKPASLSLLAAAAVPLGAATAWAAVEAAGLEPGQTVLVQGAAGGVGQYVVQVARASGATVIGTASARHAELVRSLGAEQVIDYTTTRPEQVVSGVDAVIDLVGGEVLERSTELVAKGGTLVSVVGEVSEQRAAELGIDTKLVYAKIDSELLDRVARLIDEGRLRVEVADVLPLTAAVEAHKRSEQGHLGGRLVLEVAD